MDPSAVSQEAGGREAGGSRATSAENQIWTRDFTLVTLTNGWFFGSNFIIMPVVPLYLAFLGLREGQMGLVIGIGALTGIVLRLFAGPAVDRWGGRPFLFTGIAVFILSVSLLVWAESLVTVTALRMMNGAALAIFTTAATAMAANIVPAHRRGEGMGWFGLSGNLAMTVGPALGGFLLLQTGFSGTFLVAAALGLLAFPAVYALRERPPQTASDQRQRIETYRLIAISRPAIPPSLWLTAGTFGLGGIISFIPLRAAHVDLENVGIFFTAQAVAMIISRIISGRLADRWGRAAVASPGLLLTAASMFMAAAADSPLTLVAVGVLFGAGFGAALPALTALVIDRVDPRQRGAAMATFFAAFEVGIGAGAIVLGAMIEMLSFGVAFAAAGVIAAVGAVGILWDDRRYRAKRDMAGSAGEPSPEG